MIGGLLGPDDPYAALRASQSQETDAYGNLIQGVVDPSQFLDQGALAKLGWTGGNGYDANQGAMSQDQPRSLQNNPGFTDWLTQNQYSLGGGMLPGNEQSTGYLTDASGGKLAQGNYDGSDGGLFMGLAAAGLGGFGLQAAGLGAGTGALGGAEGVGSAAAVEAAPALQSGQMSLEALRASELAGYATNGALPSSAAVDASLAAGSAVGAGPAIGNGEFVGEAPWSPSSGAAPTSQAGPMSSLDDIRAAERAGYATNGSMPSSAAVDAPWSTGDYLRNAGANVNQALSPITEPLGQAQQWMKDNPLLGKLAMSAGGGLLGGLSGGQGSKPAAQNYGPAVQWNSPISPVAQRGGLLGPPQKQAQPFTGSGLLGGGMAGLGAPQGVANNGAWQWMRGG